MAINTSFLLDFMKAIEFFELNKISNYATPGSDWYVEYCQKIVCLYEDLQRLRTSIVSHDSDLNSNAQKALNDLKYFLEKHDEADIKLVDMNTPYHEVVHVFIERYQSDEYQNFIRNQIQSNTKVPLEESNILWKMGMVLDCLEMKIVEDKKFISNYLLDFNTLCVLNTDLLYAIQEVCLDKAGVRAEYERISASADCRAAAPVCWMRAK